MKEGTLSTIRSIMDTYIEQSEELQAQFKNEAAIGYGYRSREIAFHMTELQQKTLFKIELSLACRAAKY